MIPVLIAALVLYVGAPRALREILPDSFAKDVSLLDHVSPRMAVAAYARHGPPEVIRYIPTSTYVPSSGASSSQVGEAQGEKTTDGSKSPTTFGSAGHPRPLVGEGQVIVRVEYAALNPCDFKFRRMRAMGGTMGDFFRWIIGGILLPKPTPFGKIPGADLSGVVVALGPAKPGSWPEHKFRVGDRVAAMLPLLGSRWGSMAEFVAVEEKHLAHVPKELSLRDAAAFPLVALTVVQGLESIPAAALGRATSMANAKLPAFGRSSLVGKRVLIHAGGGGVGTFAIQYCKHVLGASEVITTASSEKTDLLMSLGADIVLDYRVGSEGSGGVKDTFRSAGERGLDAAADSNSSGSSSTMLDRGAETSVPGKWQEGTGEGGEDGRFAWRWFEHPILVGALRARPWPPIPLPFGNQDKAARKAMAARRQASAIAAAAEVKNLSRTTTGAGSNDESVGPIDLVLDPMSFLYEAPSLSVMRSSQDPLGYPGGTGAEGGGAYVNILSSDWALDATSGVERAVGANALVQWALSRLRRSGWLGEKAAATSLVYSLVTVVPDGPMLQRVLDLAGRGVIKAIIDERPAKLKKEMRRRLAQAQGDGTGTERQPASNVVVDGEHNKSSDEGGEGKDLLLSDAAFAHAYLEQGHATGKVLLKVRGHRKAPDKKP